MASTRLLAVFLLLLAAIADLATAEETSRAVPVNGPVFECRLEGVLTVYSSDFLKRAVDEAAAGNGQILLVGLDTPGGLLMATKTMVQTILNAPLPVVVYVSPAGASATSAGTFITVAGHVAAMSPGTNIGAAHPVTIMPTNGESDGAKTMMEKVTNDTVAYVKSIGRLRNRDLEFLENSVRESTSIPSREALERGVIDLIADNVPQLLQKLDGREVTLVDGKVVKLSTSGAAVMPIDMTARERFFSAVSDPNIAYLLLMLGIAGLFFEAQMPGVGLPGVTGALCLSGALVAFKALPLSYTGLLLLLLGLAFLILEAHTPTHGVLGIGGLVALAMGSYLLFDTPPSIRVNVEYIAAVVGTMGFLFLFLLSRVMTDLKKPIVSGREALMASVAVAREDFDQEGLVVAEGEVWKAVNLSGQPVAKGDQLKIRNIVSGCLEVDRKDSPQSGETEGR